MGNNSLTSWKIKVLASSHPLHQLICHSIKTATRGPSITPVAHLRPDTGQPIRKWVSLPPPLCQESVHSLCPIHQVGTPEKARSTAVQLVSMIESL
jgi:hypothetical protein